MKILLASNSPRRRQLLFEMGHEVEIIRPAFEEESVAFSKPDEYVCTLAKGKGRSIAEEGERLLVAADTVVCYDGMILGKPADEESAFRTLSTLSGKVHYVYTGVYLRYKGEEYCFSDRTAVQFRTLSSEEILRYIATGSPMDKAGAYGIQDSNFAERIEGSFTNVMGFPTERFDEIIQKIIKER